MSHEKELKDREDWIEFLAFANEFRPELHRYCARLMGSIIDGEDIVQDTLVKAFTSQADPSEMPKFRAWLFRIAHNCALDQLRAKRVRRAEPLEEALEVVDTNNKDPLEEVISKEFIAFSISRFVELPITQRSVVILKDVLGESLSDISELLNISIDSVKSHLARGRAQLQLKNTESLSEKTQRSLSPKVAHYVELFNQRNWDGLRELLSADVKLKQSSHPLRVGAEDVGSFFTIYSRSDLVRLVPALLDGREVIAVFPHNSELKPSHIMWLEWQDEQISFIHDYRYIDYLLDEAELTYFMGN